MAKSELGNSVGKISEFEAQLLRAGLEPVWKTVQRCKPDGAAGKTDEKGHGANEGTPAPGEHSQTQSQNNS